MKTFAMISGLLCASMAYSWEWVEGSEASGDAGRTIATAQTVVGPTGLSSIRGIVTASDADIYKLQITSPSTFSASTVGFTVADTQLFLFDADGKGVAFNDDASASILQSQLSNQFTQALSPGTYYLAITTYDTDPVDNAMGAIWADEPHHIERAPDGPASASSVFAFEDFSYGCQYRILLTGCDPATIGSAPSPPPTDGLWMEQGDAADQIASAQITIGEGPMVELRGELSAVTDVDVYKIRITSPVMFTATTAGTGTSAADTQLYLFRADGTGVAFNEDDPSGFGFQATLDSSTGPLISTPGTYYIAVAYYGSMATSSTGQIWTTPNFSNVRTVRPPDGPGASQPLTGWIPSAEPIAGDYIVRFTGVEYWRPLEEPLFPTSIDYQSGSAVSGGLAEILESDDQYLSVRPGAVPIATLDPVRLRFFATAPSSSASSIKVTVESRGQVKNIRQIIEVRNYHTNTYTVLDVFPGLPASGTDRTVTLVVPNPNDHIGPGNQLEIRIRCKAAASPLFPWQVRFDRVTWSFRLQQ